MWIGVISIFPELLVSIASAGVLGRAVKRGDLAFEVFNPRNYAEDRRRTVDDRPYGGGPGMVMLAEPLLQAVAAARAAAPSPPLVVYLSPQGRRLDQPKVQSLAELPSLVLLAGRYEGIDQRVIDLAVDEELSIGDYVLSGGELPAMVVVEALCRLLPGVLNNQDSILSESHLDGLLEYPHYTRPESVRAASVPEVLMCGDHGAVAKWRRKQALLRTWRERPDLLSARRLEDEDIRLLRDALAVQAQDGSGGED